MLPGKELNRKVWHRDRTVKLRFERNWDGSEGERDLPDCDFELVWYVYHAHVTCFKSLWSFTDLVRLEINRLIPRVFGILELV